MFHRVGRKVARARMFVLGGGRCAACKDQDHPANTFVHIELRSGSASQLKHCVCVWLKPNAALHASRKNAQHALAPAEVHDTRHILLTRDLLSSPSIPSLEKALPPGVSKAAPGEQETPPPAVTKHLLEEALPPGDPEAASGEQETSPPPVTKRLQKDKQSKDAAATC